MKANNPYRIFICYSHNEKDETLAKEIYDYLDQDDRLQPIMDKGFIPGTRFRDQIEESIAHAHVFVPLFTPESIKKGWVQQEIGFATAHNIPVLPICKGSLPAGMAGELQCLQWGKAAFDEYLGWDHLDLLVRKSQESHSPLYLCAKDHGQRTRMMYEFAETVLNLKFFGHVRQKGALSSFHIPDKSLTDDVWKERYGGIERDKLHKELLRKERQALTKHAKAAGFSLMIDLDLDYKDYGPEARPSRLWSLLEFFQSMQGVEIPMRVGISNRMHEKESLTMVGDWFLAESVSASLGRGYRQTIFTRHAPTILKRIHSFDEELDTLLARQNINPDNSVLVAIQEIKKRLADISGDG